MNQLADVNLHRKRAHDLLAELKTLCSRVCLEQAKATIVKHPPNPSLGPGESVRIEVTTGNALIPDDCKILTGEIVNHLRSSLDYMVGMLVEMDSGKKGNKTQFPIASTEQDFKGCFNFIRGLNDSHIAAIEQLQPFKGCSWTKNLAYLNNKDKHNELIIVGHDYKFNLSILSDSIESDVKRIHVQLEPTFMMQNSNGLPLIETLEEIETQVSDIVERFMQEPK